MNLLVGIIPGFQNILRTVLVQLYMMTLQKLQYLKLSIYKLLNGLVGPSNMVHSTVSHAVTAKSKPKPSVKYFRSSEHSIKAYADDAKLISDCVETHSKALKQLDRKASTWIFHSNLQNMCPISLMVHIIVSRALSY